MLPLPGTLDGIDLLPQLRGERPAATDRSLFWRWVRQGETPDDQSWAVRSGPWKLLGHGRPEQAERSRMQPVHLPDDPLEQTDLSAEQPELVETLHARMIEWSAELPEPTEPVNPAKLRRQQGRKKSDGS